MNLETPPLPGPPPDHGVDRVTPPDVFADLARHVVRTSGTQRGVARDNPQRDVHLGDSRRQLDDQIINDARWNYERLWDWATTHGMGRAMDDRLIRHGLQRLFDQLPALASDRRWTGNIAEFTCFQGFQQFYCNALSIAQRLDAYDRGAPPPRPWIRYRRRPKVGESAAADRWVQAVGNALDQALPDGLELSPLRSVWPSMWYSVSRTLPMMPFSWLEQLRRLRRLLTDKGLAALAGLEHLEIEVRDDAGLRSGFELIDGHGHTRHNIILAFGHRHSTLDLPIMAEALGGLEHVVWASAAYFPPGAARDPHTILVRSGSKSDLAPVLQRSEEVLSEQRLCLGIYVDGAAPYLPYGQQMRVKRGIRMLVDHMATRTRNQRRTLIVPVTMDDTMGVVRQLDRRVVVTFHEPLPIDEIDPPANDHERINYGDPLLNYLESLMACRTAAARYGYRTPRVIQTVRRVHNRLAERSGPRAWMKRRLHASLTELGRDQAVRQTGEPQNPKAES